MVALLALFLLQSAEEWLAQGLGLLKAGREVEARSALETAAKQAPGQPVVWLAVAEARLRSGDAAAAIGAMAQAERLGPDLPMVQKGREMFARRMGQLGQQWLDARQEKRAETVLLLAVKEFPREPELHRLLGLALYAQGRNADAVRAFLAAIRVAPDEELLYAGLETLLPAGKEVEICLVRYAEKHPGSAMAWYLLGLERADPSLFAKSWALDGQFWPAAFALHSSLEAEKGIPLLERVVALNPEYAPAYYALSQLYAKSGLREKALAARKRHHALTRQP